MISVPFYSNESFMANSALKQRTALGIKLGLGAISLLLTIILGLIGVIWDTTKDKVKSIETTISVINISQTKQGELLAKQVELLARLDERFKSVDDRTKSLEERTKTLELAPYRSKAVAAGFKNPEIITTKFAKNESFKSRVMIQNQEQFIQYTILGYDKSTKQLTIGVNAKIGMLQLDHNTFVMTIKAEPGKAEEVTFIRGEGIPRIFLQVLETPTHDSAILAIGPKTGLTNTPS